MSTSFRVVLLTDSPMINKIIQSALDERFETTAMESNTAGFFDTIVEQKPDVVFLRTVLKEGNGLEVCDRIKNNPDLGKTRIIFLSTDNKVREQAIHHRADRFLTIPFNASDVKKVIDALFRKPAKILYVDDSDMFHEVVVPALRDEGWQVLEAWDGREALELVDHEQVDLILSDLEMPSINGIQLCQSVRKSLDRDIPFVLLTSQTSEETIQQAFDAGADEYMTKPVIIPEVIARVKRLLNTAANQYRAERILVVDDEASIRSMTVKALKAQGFYVEEAEHGMAAWAKLLAKKFHLVVSDYTMPHLDGVELSLRIRKHDHLHLRQMPIIFATSRNAKADTVKIRSIGVQSFLAKPFTPDRVAAEVERVLAHHRMERQHDLMRSYLSEEMIERIESVDASQDTVAEDQFRTMIQIGIANFAALSQRITSSEIVKLLNLFHDHLADVFSRRDIVIDDSSGDVVLASSGRQEEGAMRILCAALELQQLLADTKLTLGHTVKLRAGIHSGHVIAAHLGSQLQGRKLVLIGRNLDITHQIMQATPENHIYMSDTTHDLVARMTESSSKGALPGGDGTVQLFHVTAVPNCTKQKGK
ncbi:MAG: response regulator [Magnetococcales bacterium]|nr:response regulator [Magnetococcales bacterium]